MCLAIPMRVVTIDGVIARCEARGVERDVCLLLVGDQPIAAGDHLLVHVGYAIQKVSDDEASTIWDTFDAVLALEDGLDDGRRDRLDDVRRDRLDDVRRDRLDA